MISEFSRITAPPDMAALKPLSPGQRQKIILAQANSAMMRSLWDAALGGAGPQRTAIDRSGHDWAPTGPFVPDLCSLTGWLADEEALDAPASAETAINTPQDADALALSAVPARYSVSVEGGQNFATRLSADRLGPNSAHASTIEAVAQRTGIPASVLASVIDAEAGRNADGSWNAMSRNPRSSAAGLGQFLSGTWLDLAQQPGSWLHGEANRRGWLLASGRVDPTSKSALLGLRYDSDAAIQAIGDFAARNLSHLRSKGQIAGNGVGEIGRAIYLTHHLGAGDASQFLGGGLTAKRAGALLSAQVGKEEAARRIALAGDASLAHRRWLDAYIARKIQPEKYLRSA